MGEKRIEEQGTETPQGENTGKHRQALEIPEERARAPPCESRGGRPVRVAFEAKKE